MLRGLFKSNTPELENLPEAPWSNKKRLPAHCWQQIPGDMIKIPSNPFSKTKGATITDVAAKGALCHIKASSDNKTLYFIDVKTREGFLVATNVDGVYRILTYKPNVDGQVAITGVTGLRQAPLYLCGTVEKDDERACVYYQCTDDEVKTSICSVSFADGVIVITEDGRKEPIAKATRKKSNGTFALFLQVARGLDTLAMIAVTMCAADCFVTG